MSFDKTARLFYLYGSQLQQATLIEEIGLCEENHILLKSKVLELTDTYESIYHRRVEGDHFELFFKYLKEQLQQRMSVVWSGLVWCTADFVNEAADEWRWYLRACVRAKGHHF